MAQSIHVHLADLPADFDPGASVAVDTETLGLKPARDRLCVAQLSAGDGVAHLVQIQRGVPAPRLKALLEDRSVLKLFHFARFDIASLKVGVGADTGPIYCTKIASRLARTYTDKHGLKDLCRELLGVEISKQQQSSDWGADALSADQRAYAASDVLHLHQLREKLDAMLAREGRDIYAQACFDFLSTRVALDLGGWDDLDIFAH